MGKFCTRIKKAVIVLAALSLICVSPAIWKIAKSSAAAIAKGGSAIEVAVPITTGTYTGIPLAPDEETFYSVPVKAGQELQVTGSFKVASENAQYGTLNTMEIFNESREKLISKFEDAGTKFSVAALADSRKATQTFYLRISDDTWGTEDGEITVALNDKYDANSGTDAGNDFDKALSVSSGSFTGYLSEVDSDDMYKISAKAGAFSAKVTPASTAGPYVKIFDANRTELVNEFASNNGEIVTASTTLAKDQNVFVKVTCDINMGCEDAASGYGLEIGATVSGGDTEKPENYDIVVPIVPDVGGLVTVDKEVAPVLKKVYDDKVKLQKQTGKTTLIYIVSRQVNSAADLQAIKAAMEGLGYKTKSISDTQLVMTKGFKKLTFTVANGSNKIEVKSGWAVNWLWLGIILGIIVLIIIVVMVIVISKGKKKSVSAKPETPAPVAAPAPTANNENQ